MSHIAHTTRAYVLSKRNVGEANCLFKLFTRNFGVIQATAQSVRLERSKLRFGLQRFSLAEVSIVRGRAGWRITNTFPQENLFFAESREQQRIVIAVTSLLNRLIVGELKDTDLFDLVVDGFRTLHSLPEDELGMFELVFVANILVMLGYGTESGIFEEFRTADIASQELRERADRKRKMLISEINAALSSTGL